MALYALHRLGEEAAPGTAAPAPGAWRGITLAVDVASADEVDVALGAAVQAGAELVGAPVTRDWGGRSGYVADPEGNRWEIAWLPGFLPPAG